MTVLNFYSQANFACLVTDSSFSDPDDMLPVGFCTKAYLVPHLEGIIAGTGHLQLIVDWFVRVNTGFVGHDMIELNEHAPPAMQKLFAEHLARHGQDFTTTIYHWGYDRGAGAIVSWAYRSTANFEPEPLPYMNAFKPRVDTAGMPLANFPADYLAIVEKQKAEDEALPLSNRVGVGGHMNAYMMQPLTEEATGEVTVTLSTWRVQELSGYTAGFNHAANRRPR